MPRPRSAHPRDPAVMTLTASVVALEFGVSPDDILRPDRRGPEADYARQIAAYLVHTVFSLTMTRVGELLKRHGSTISHACEVVEQDRSDPALDDRLDRLEQYLASAPRLEPLS